jgi:hypothetical protein
MTQLSGPPMTGSGGDAAALTSAELPPGLAPGPALLPADTQLTYTGDVNGTQRWVSADQSVVQYRAAGRLLTFHGWKRSHLIYWSMGASVTADGENWDAAIIDSNYYMTVPERTPCEIVKVGQSTSRNSSYFDEWQWGVSSQQPERAACLCRVQWNGARFTDLVTAGTGCTRYQNDQWPTGYPADWPPLPAGIEVSPASLAMQVKGLGINAASRTVILNHTASDVPVQIAPDTTDYFDWPSGTFTVPAHGGLPITVMFQGGNAPGSYRTSVRIVAGQGAQFTVPVIVTVSASGPDK